VTKILSFETDFDISTRAYSVKVGILTEYGETDLTVTV